VRISKMFKNKLFMNFLKVYFILLIIPIFTLTFVYVTVYKDGVSDILLSQEKRSLKSVRISIDNVINRVNSYYFNYVATKTVPNLILKNTVESNITLFENYLNMIINDDILKEVIIFNPANEKIYSKKNIVNIEHYLSIERNFDSNNAACARDFFFEPKNDAVKLKLHLPDTEGDFFVYKIAYEFEDADSRLNFIFLLDAGYFEKVFGSVQGESFLLLNDTLLMSNGTEFNDKIDEIKMILASGTDNPYKKFTLYNEKYVAYSLVSEENSSLKYYNIIAENEALKKLGTINLIIVLVLVLMLILGFIIIPFVAKRNYRPIQSIEHLAESMNIDFSGDINELETKFLEISHKNSEISCKISEYNLIQQDLCLLKLLRGNWSSSDFSLFQGIIYRVALLSSDKPAELPALINECENLFLNYKDFVLHILDSDCIVFFLNDDDFKAAEKISSMRKHIASEIDSNIIIGVGRPYNVENIYVSYSEARVAIEYDRVFGHSRPVFYEEINHSSKATKYPSELIDKLKLHLINCDYDETMYLVSELISYMKNENMSVEFVRCTSYEIVNIIIRETAKIDSEGTGRFDIHIESFTKIDTIDRFVNIVQNFLNYYEKALEYKKQENEKNEMKDVLKYIREHFFEPDFSVSKVSEKFGFSASALSKRFKNEMGFNISDYIRNLQIDKSQMLLISTNMSIQEIANAVGQQDTSNFIRNFKKKVGVTPGEYRVINK